MRQTLELPRLSLAERDRRWAAVRKEMAARSLDAIVLWGWPTMWDFYTANARYLARSAATPSSTCWYSLPTASRPRSCRCRPSSRAGARRRTG